MHANPCGRPRCRTLTAVILSLLLVAVAPIAFPCLTGCNIGSNSRNGNKGGGTAGPPAVTGPTQPAIIIDTPVPGSWHTAPDALVQGHTTAVAGDVVSVTVNGQPAIMEADGRFAGPIAMTEGMNHISVRAENRAGDRFFSHCSYMYSGSYGDPAAVVPDAAIVRLNAQALPFLIDMLNRDFLATIDLAPIVMGLNPIFATSFLFGVVTVQIDVTDLQSQGLTAGMDLVQDGVAIHAEMDQVVIDLVAQDQGGFTIPFNVGGQITADKIIIDTVARLTIQPDGTVTSALDPNSVTLQGFGITLNGVPQFVVDLVKNTVRDLVQDKLVDALNQQIPAFLDQELNSLMGPSTVTLNAVDLTYQIVPSTIAIDSTGLEVGLGVRLDAPLAPGVTAPPGYMATPGSPPVLTTNKAIAATIDDDLINMAMTVAWQSGLIQFELDDSMLAGGGFGGISSLEFGALGAQLFPELDGHIDPTTPMILRLSAGLPPYVRLGGAGFVDMQIGELYLEVLVDQNGVLEPIVGLTVHADVAVDVTIDSATNVLTIAIPQRPTFLFDVRDQPMTALDPLRLQTLLTLALDAMLPSLMTNAQLQIPAFFGIELINLDFAVEGPAADHLTIGADVQLAPPAPPAPAPTPSTP